MSLNRIPIQYILKRKEEIGLTLLSLKNAIISKCVFIVKLICLLFWQSMFMLIIIWDLLSAGNAISVVRDRSNVMQSEGMSNLSLSLAALLLLSSSVSPSPGLLSVKV